VSVGDAAIGLTRTIQNVAAGVNGTDAVNLKQLNTKISGVGVNTFNLPDPVATGAGSTAVAVGAAATGDYAVAFGQSANAAGTSSTAIGRAAQALGANSVALGQGAVASAMNSVAIGNGTVADRPNTVSLGGRQLVNLAPGTSGTDAVNLNQLQGVERHADGGIATAIAMSGVWLPADKKYAVSTNLGVFGGETALAAGAALRLTDNAILNGSVGFGVDGGVGGRVGVSFAW
jgi:autotransporter adhesin